MNARCDQSDLLVAECAHCRGHTDPVQAQRALRAALDRAGWLTAQYPGVCIGCDEHFPVGARITGGPRGYRAECCANGIEAGL